MRCGELKSEGNSVAEGIGQGRITANLEGAPIDTQFRISDEEGLEWVRSPARRGGAVPRPVVGHQRRGRDRAGAGSWGRARRIVTILCDTGFRYLSSLFNPTWLEAKGLPVPPWLAHD